MNNTVFTNEFFRKCSTETLAAIVRSLTIVNPDYLSRKGMEKLLFDLEHNIRIAKEGEEDGR